MSESFAYQASIKYGPNGQHMLNVRADTAEEFAEKLKALPVGELLEAGAVVLGGEYAARTLDATVVTSTPAPVAAPVVPQQAAPPAVETKTCPHGTKVFREGVSKAGKPYRAYFCPSPKGTPDQCPAEFV